MPEIKDEKKRYFRYPLTIKPTKEEIEKTIDRHDFKGSFDRLKTCSEEAKRLAEHCFYYGFLDQMRGCILLETRLKTALDDASGRGDISPREHTVLYNYLNSIRTGDQGTIVEILKEKCECK